MKRQLFTIGFLFLSLMSSTVRAERVVLLPPRGEAPQERLDAIEEAIAAAIAAVGHGRVTESGVSLDSEPPSTANEMRAIAEMQNAQYLVVTRVTLQSGGYVLFLRVGYAPAGRVEELQVEVQDADQAARLRLVMAAILRPDGLGEDAVRLTEGSGTEPVSDEEARRRQEEEAQRAAAEAQRRQEEEARQRGEVEARERERLEEARRRRQQEWAERERYGQRAPWMFSVGLDLRPLIAHREIIIDGQDRGGGVLGGFSLRLGHSFGGLPGFELRGAFDIVTGASSGFVLAGGAVYLASPFRNAPVFIGGGIETGLFQFLSGNTVPSFMVRASPVIVWRATDNIYVEGALPELMLLTANGGAASLGLSVRAGLRF